MSLFDRTCLFITFLVMGWLLGYTLHRVNELEIRIQMDAAIASLMHDKVSK